MDNIVKISSLTTERIIISQSHIQEKILERKNFISLSTKQQISLSGEIENKTIPFNYWDHIINALATNSSQSTTERLAFLMKAIDVDPTCHIAWRLVAKFDEKNPDYNRRYNRQGPEAYIAYKGNQLSMIDVSVRILELVPLDYNIWMWIGVHLLAQDGARGGCLLACKILGKE